MLTAKPRATIVAKKVLNWKKNNSGPSAAEIRAELRRLQNLLVSHQTLQKVRYTMTQRFFNIQCILC